MWWSRRLLTEAALLKRAEALGVSTAGDERETDIGTIPTSATEHELQRRVREAERHLREARLALFAGASACAAVVGALVGVGGLLAAIYFGHQQTENAKRLLSVQLAREFRDGFDSKEMQRHRVDTAAALLRRADPPTDDVPDFFDSIGFYAKRGAIDEEVVWNDFGYTITHYWPALKAYAARVRTGPDGDPDYWANFEWLNDKLVQSHPHGIPAMDDVQEFLKDEAALLKPAKSTPPRKVRRGQPQG